MTATHRYYGHPPPSGLPESLSSSRLYWCSKSTRDGVTVAIFASSDLREDRLLELIDPIADCVCAWRIANRERIHNQPPTSTPWTRIPGHPLPPDLPSNLTTSTLFWCGKTTSDNTTVAIYAPLSADRDRLLSLTDGVSDRLAAWRIAPNFVRRRSYISEPVL